MNAINVKEVVLKKIQKRLRQVIRTYEKVIEKLEVQLAKMNRLEEEEADTTVRQTILLGLDQSRKHLMKARLDYQKVLEKQADLVSQAARDHQLFL
ncbi:hypothetical protein [Spirosoma aerophilum]